MTAQLLLDFDAAVELHVTMTTVADELDHDRRALAGPVADAADLIGSRGIDPDPHLRAVAELLRREADDLARRVRMIAFGGPEINAGLHALDVIAANWDTIDNQGRPDGNDGIISRSDLEWAADNLDPAVAAAARWLLDHDEFFTAVETAKHNDDYLADGGAGFASGGDGDGKLSRDDLTSYVTKLDTWATLIPYMSTIDIAAHGGDLDGVMSKRDFEAFLDDQTLPPQVRDAAQQVLDDSAYHDTGGIGWDDVLMVASFIPIVGDFIDGAMALYYLAQGDWEQAALSGLGLLPIPGMTGASVRGAKAAAEELSEEFLEEGLETIAQRTVRENLDDAGGAVRRTDAEDLAEVPAMSGARRADEAGGSPSGGGGGSAPEPLSSSGSSSSGPSSGAEPPSGSQTPSAKPDVEPTPVTPPDHWPPIRTEKLEEPRDLNFRPDNGDPDAGFSPVHRDKHFRGDDPDFSLRLLDPGGSEPVWMQHFASLADRRHTVRHKNEVLDVLGDFPRTDGSGVLRLGIRIQEPAPTMF